MKGLFRRQPNTLFFLYIVPAGYFMVRIDTEFNAPYGLAFRYLLLPAILIAYALTFTWWSDWAKRQSIVKIICWPALVAAMLVLFAGGYVSYLNTVIGPQSEVVIEGSVADKHHHRGSRGSSYSIDVIGEHGQMKTLYVTREEYEELEVGADFRREMTMGGLGFAYNWR